VLCQLLHLGLLLLQTHLCHVHAAARAPLFRPLMCLLLLLLLL
jgi:hypothetical protein